MRKLPVSAAVEQSFHSIFAYSIEAAKISAPWLAAGFLLLVIQGLFGPTQDFDPRTISSAMSSDQMFGAAIWLFNIFFYLFALSSIAVNWHRYALRDEMPSKFSWLRFDGLAWKYFGNLLATFTLVIVSAMILMFGFFMTAANDNSGLLESDFIMLIVANAGGVMVVFLLSILSTKLPAIALNAPKVTFVNTFKIVKGNYGRIAQFTAAIWIVLALIRWVFGLIDKFILVHAGITGSVLSIMMHLADWWFATMVGIATVTTLYGFFVEKRDYEAATAETA